MRDDGRWAPVLGTVRDLAEAGQAAAARAVLAPLLSGVRQLGAARGLPAALTASGLVEVQAGRLDTAVDAITEALTTAEAEVRREALALLARVHAIRGAGPACRAAAAQAGDRAAPLLLVLGTAEIGAAPRADTDRGPWTADRLEAHLRRGGPLPPGLAATLDSRAEATGLPLPDAVAARMAAMAAGATRGAEWFEIALRRHADTDCPFERGRTHLVYGERLRRAGLRVRAREQLHAAATVFDDMGACPWSARAHAELSACAGSPARPAGPAAARLTPQESHVAEAVATGMTNQEVATTLFVSVKTVEFHLGNIYRKLGVRNRTQLARRASPGPAIKQG